MYHQRVDQATAFGVAAFVLAGGKSTRMGKDKAFLELGGRTLLAHALDLAGTVARDVRIVGEANKFAAFGSVVEDVYHERGPLGGIHAALASTTTELNLMLAVDLPFLQPEFLKYLISEARKTGALVTVPRAGGGLQPLFAEVETRVLGEEDLSRAGFSEGMFRNLNTPEEWEEAKLER